MAGRSQTREPREHIERKSRAAEQQRSRFHRPAQCVPSGVMGIRSSARRHCTSDVQHVSAACPARRSRSRISAVRPPSSSRHGEFCGACPAQPTMRLTSEKAAHAQRSPSCQDLASMGWPAEVKGTKVLSESYERILSNNKPTHTHTLYALTRKRRLAVNTV